MQFIFNYQLNHWSSRLYTSTTSPTNLYQTILRPNHRVKSNLMKKSIHFQVPELSATPELTPDSRKHSKTTCLFSNLYSQHWDATPAGRKVHQHSQWLRNPWHLSFCLSPQMLSRRRCWKWRRRSILWKIWRKWRSTRRRMKRRSLEAVSSWTTFSFVIIPLRNDWYSTEQTGYDKHLQLSESVQVLGMCVFFFTWEYSFLGWYLSFVFPKVKMNVSVIYSRE